MVAPAPVRVVEDPSLGDVLRSVGPALYRQPFIDAHQRRVLWKLAHCKTGTLGFLQLGCPSCGSPSWEPMACHDRHCPSCGFQKSKAWAEARMAEVLDVPYFHLVFTVPGKLRGIARENPEVFYNLMFAASRDVLFAFARDPKFLGGTPAVFSLLHTTNQQLGYHPHIHSLVAGCVLDEVSGRLVRVKSPKFLFPARALAAGFRGRMIAGLRDLRARGSLELATPGTQGLADVERFESLMDELSLLNWQLRTEAVEGDPRRVVRYLARYTYRTALSNRRLLKLRGNRVLFSWKDRRRKRWRKRWVSCLDLVKRFSQHILPHRFKRARFYGLLSATKRGKLLEQARFKAGYLAQLEGFQHAVQTALKPEQLPASKCACCGALGLIPVAVHRPGGVVQLSPTHRPIPPPLSMCLPKQEA